MTVPWWGALPFALLLACIAVAPLLQATSRAWERNTVKLVVSLACGVPVALWFIAGGAGTAVLHALIEYAQFICLLLALFVISGGIFLRGDLRATPLTNTVFLGVGGILASFVGTTGAAMLLIRPLLNTNRERRHRVHTVVFTIFIVANCGGLLTPLGDPPLFLGFLRGIPFTWTFGLWPQWLFVNALLLVSYYGLDRRAYAQEPAAAITRDDSELTPLSVAGKIHLVFFAMVIAAVALLPSIDLHTITTGHPEWSAWVPWRELVFLAAAALSYFLGTHEVRFVLNRFSWGPILEVAALFIGIFLAMIPALRYLGQIAGDLPLNRITFFLFSGGLSAFLDNAPTYATFFEMAAQLPDIPRVGTLPGVPEDFLVSVSLGSVLCGAITYIGNGPNFMTKAVADDAGVGMPSFGGYIVWSLRYLVPVLVAMALIFLTEGPAWRVAGVALAIAIVARALRLARAHRDPHAPQVSPGDRP